MFLYLLNDMTSNGFHNLSLTFITLTALLCGILVIVSKNPIVSVLFLIGLFLSISIYLMLLGLNFIGLSYLLVYVGAVSILFLFILMLINIRISEIISSTSNSIPLAIIIGVFFFSTLYQALPLAISPVVYANTQSSTIVSGFTIIKHQFTEYIFGLFDLFTSNNVSNTAGFTSKYSALASKYKNQILELVSSQSWDSMLAESTHITTLGNILYTTYPMWLILTSLILLLAMVGAIVITIKN